MIKYTKPPLVESYWGKRNTDFICTIRKHSTEATVPVYHAIKYYTWFVSCSMHWTEQSTGEHMHIVQQFDLPLRSVSVLTPAENLVFAWLQCFPLPYRCYIPVRWLHRCKVDLNLSIEISQALATFVSHINLLGRIRDACMYIILMYGSKKVSFKLLTSLW